MSGTPLVSALKITQFWKTTANHQHRVPEYMFGMSFLYIVSRQYQCMKTYDIYDFLILFEFPETVEGQESPPEALMLGV